MQPAGGRSREGERPASPDFFSNTEEYGLARTLALPGRLSDNTPALVGGCIVLANRAKDELPGGEHPTDVLRLSFSGLGCVGFRRSQNAEGLTLLIERGRCCADASGGNATRGADGGATVASSADAQSAFSGTSILSPLQSQRSGAGLASEQSTTHWRSWPVIGPWRVTLT